MTNNFYYRCTPFDALNKKFIGRKTAQGTYAPVTFGPYGGNTKFLGFPTTILDMGPKTFYIQELVMSDKYDAYVVNKMGSTTYQDVSEILNLLIINRLINTSFIKLILGGQGASILAYFSRNKNFVDGDYAQLISINSELGVFAFQAENYPDDPQGQDPIFFNNGDGDPIMGISFLPTIKQEITLLPKEQL